jgi:hypothetical protein
MGIVFFAEHNIRFTCVLSLAQVALLSMASQRGVGVVGQSPMQVMSTLMA